ncbi:hypothetical protein THERMOS_1332 [Bathymodiolus thermophilus thioautotrophic gill symbiont]|uniref:Uncharacterized protein n=1 Tax=Bathymodiolus thermophilus thioautotrophic gill symbiont TaxID=2360 RepID=A0A8H9CFU9_9GAMM|nr:hypothetical protein [Bathymodiolus thermophilus thioautotrophic gill symbiont]CAB5501085.1 hypothetical protein THERMOS_1332 [Bathymodiolus thermophilus thioautotrophic gill symbiont]
MQSFCYATFALGGIPPSAKCGRSLLQTHNHDVVRFCADSTESNK